MMEWGREGREKERDKLQSKKSQKVNAMLRALRGEMGDRLHLR